MKTIKLTQGKIALVDDADFDANGKKIYIGYFYSETDAARARDAAALKYHGKFASLNFPIT